jgi:hypothetical protein
MPATIQYLRIGVRLCESLGGSSFMGDLDLCGVCWMSLREMITKDSDERWSGIISAARSDVAERLREMAERFDPVES